MLTCDIIDLFKDYISINDNFLQLIVIFIYVWGELWMDIGNPSLEKIKPA